MPVLSSGLVIAGAYADKVRRTLFAQLKDSIRKGDISAQEVARAAGELNRILYHILVDKLRIDKGDVVRVRISYDIEDGKIKWDYSSLNIEVFKREQEDKIGSIIHKVIPEVIGIPKPTYVPPIADFSIVGERDKESFIALRNSKGENIGFLKLEEKDKGITLNAIIVDAGRAYKAYAEYEKSKAEALKDKEWFVNFLKKLRYEEIPITDAKKIIQEFITSIGVS